MTARLRALGDDELAAYREAAERGYATSIEERGGRDSLGYEESAVWMGKDLS